MAHHRKFTKNDNLEQRLEPEGDLSTARILSHWKGGVLELNVGELRLASVEGAELHHVELELFITETADTHMADPPQSPEDFPPCLQLQLERLDEV